VSARLEGKVAVITGGSRGIGRAIAKALLDDGAAVCITGRKSASLEEAAAWLAEPARVLTVAGPSDDAEHQQAVMAAAADRFGSVHILVNNAGVNPSFGPLVGLHGDSADKIWRANVRSCLAWAQEFQRQRHEAQPGAIVNIASFSAVRPTPGIGMYGVSKAALLQLTRELALELAPHVRVNAVIPALIITDFSRALHEGREDEAASRYPLRRLGGPQDVAEAVAFLASDAAAWVTGTSILIDGGLSLTGGA
jgi:NAD(P)-dependent dehydrogenase (short-subunit alcohol dehydrogenase family)